MISWRWTALSRARIQNVGKSSESDVSLSVCAEIARNASGLFPRPGSEDAEPGGRLGSQIKSALLEGSDDLPPPKRN